MISLIFAKILHFIRKWPITLWEIFILNYSISVGIEDVFWEKNIHICPRNTYINPFHANVLFLYPMKTSEKPAISSIHTEYGEIRSISPYLVRMLENAGFLSFLRVIEMEQ